ncbi:MAG: outer membrane protein assembly factor BamA [Gammaproteobacteria bacterium]|nr:outer membrane protein assembly factor BamA [Gammaproteobacteria bacterium]
MKKLLYIVWLCAASLSTAWALEPFVVKDIRVEGLQRIAAGTVFNYLPVKVGDTLDEARSQEAIRALFKTGFFKDVRLERDGEVLVVIVDERPAIASIKFFGNKDIDTETLTKALKGQGLAEGEVFDRSLLDKVEQELKRQYFSRGKYAVQVTTTATPLERNRMAVTIDVSEGRAARIKEINIVGNQAFPDEDLLDEFQLSTPTLISFYTDSDQYSKQKLSADLETLRSFYLDRGYIAFNIDSTQVSITPDKQDIYITINVTEGDVFTVKETKIAGETVVPSDDLAKLIEVEKGGVFSRKAATESSARITERLGEEGYAFANVNIVPDIAQAEKQVTLTFFVDPGKRVYVRRINFAGNTKTRDEVLRREMRQVEGGWISTEKIKRSRARLEKLGYFAEVNVETPAVPGTTDQVDANFTVVEKPSGNLLAGLGFSQSQGIIFNTSVSQDNFLGSGKRVNLAFNNSTVNTTYSFGYTNPYYTLDGVSRGFSLFSRKTDAAEANIAQYTTDTLGGFVNFGIPINEFDSVQLGLGYENIDVKTGTETPVEFSNFLAANDTSFDTIKLSAGWAHDTRNRAAFATEGVLQNFSAELGVPGGNLQYYKASYRHQWLHPLGTRWGIMLNGDAGYGDSYGDTTELPFFENLYGGGPRSVRGFKENSLGPRSASTGRALGGNMRLVGNAELIFPTPFVRDSKSVRLSGFVDAGGVFSNQTGYDSDGFRYSTGVSGQWLSPLGALTVSIAVPLNDKATDETQVFQFTFGAPF